VIAADDVGVRKASVLRREGHGNGRAGTWWKRLDMIRKYSFMEIL
jgi:hypothetical protein